MSKPDESINFLKNINGLYGGDSYLEKNGMSVLVASVIIIVVFSIITFSEISNHLNTIKQDWPNKRCDPKYMPLAGFINAPPGESKWGYTAKNFGFCVNNILGEITQFITNPQQLIIGLVSETLGAVNAMMSKLSEFISTIRTDVINFALDVVARVLNLLVPIITMWHKMYDILKRSTGVIGFIVYFVDLIFFAVMSWTNLLVSVLIEWLLYVFEVMGITGLVFAVFLLPIIGVILFNFGMMIYAAIMEGVGLALLTNPFTAIVGGAIEGSAIFTGTVGATGATVASGYLLAFSAVSLAVLSAILIVMELYIVFILDPMKDFMGLFPGFIQLPKDANTETILWWVNALDITKSFVKPVEFEKTSQATDKQSTGKEITGNTTNKSPSGMSFAGEISKGKKESFRNIFY
jgi:hypothetical protein